MAPGPIPDPVPEPVPGPVPGPVSGPVPHAYRHCERVVRARARNFAYGIRLLPPPKRRALSAVYAFARRIDDIGDGDIGHGDIGHGDIGDAAGTADARLTALEEARARLRALRAGPADPVTGESVTGEFHSVPAALVPGELMPADLAAGHPLPDAPIPAEPATADPLPVDPFADDPVLVALRDAAARFPVPLEAFEELIGGCAADVAGAHYRSYDDLVGYCRAVAGSIGRLSLGVFGLADGAGADEGAVMRAARLANSLGVALQLTNILRDLREDRLAGRVYLPADDLRRFGCTLGVDAAGAFTDPPERLARLVRFEAARALGWYAEGSRLIPLLDRRSAACTAAMAGIYRRLLDRIAADPARVRAGRLSLAPWTKAVVAARAVAGAGR